MLHRKVLLIALLAVVLLGSSMDGSVSIDGRGRRKPRRAETAAGAIAEVVPNFGCASLTNLMDQITAGFAAADPNNLMASLKPRKPHRTRASVDSGSLSQAAVVIGAADPNNDQVDPMTLKRRRGGRKG